MATSLTLTGNKPTLDNQWLKVEDNGSISLVDKNTAKSELTLCGRLQHYLGFGPTGYFTVTQAIESLAILEASDLARSNSPSLIVDKNMRTIETSRIHQRTCELIQQLENKQLSGTIHKCVLFIAALFNWVLNLPNLLSTSSFAAPSPVEIKAAAKTLLTTRSYLLWEGNQPKKPWLRLYFGAIDKSGSSLSHQILKIYKASQPREGIQIMPLGGNGRTDNNLEFELIQKVEGKTVLRIHRYELGCSEAEVIFEKFIDNLIKTGRIDPTVEILQSSASLHLSHYLKTGYDFEKPGTKMQTSFASLSSLYACGDVAKDLIPFDLLEAGLANL